MPDFMSDGPIPETPAGAAAESYAGIAPPFGQTFLTGAFSYTGGLARSLTESLYRPEGFAARLERGIVATSELEGGVPPEERVFGADLGAKPLPDPPFPGDEIDKRYAPTGPDGKKVSIAQGQPMGAKLGELLGSAKADELEREMLWSRFSGTHSWPVTFASGLASNLLDPLAVATLFLPGIGEEAFAGAAARIGLTGLAARTAARAAAGGVSAAAGTVPLTALQYGVGLQENADYGLRDAFRDLLFNAVAGAVTHAGIAPAIGAAWRYVRPSATTHFDAMKAAVSQIDGERPVDVTPVLDAAQADIAAAAPEGVSFFITQGQKVQLGERGYTAEQIREMKPEEAHRILGITPTAAEAPRVSTLTEAPRAPETTFNVGGVTVRGGENLFDVAQREELVSQIAASLENPYVEGTRRYAEQERLNRETARAVIMPERSSPAQVAEAQRALYREGFVQGTPQSELAQTKAEIQATEPAKPSATPSGQPIAPATQEAAVVAEELAQAEREFAARPPAVRDPEEEAALSASADALTRSEGLSRAAEASAGCLIRAGLI